MKAYQAWDTKAMGPWSTIIFAENVREAKKVAASSEVCECAEWIDIRVRRCPKADGLYKGASEINWNDMETRLALVRDLGMACFDPSWECDTCDAKPYCEHWIEN